MDKAGLSANTKDNYKKQINKVLRAAADAGWDERELRTAKPDAILKLTQGTREKRDPGKAASLQTTSDINVPNNNFIEFRDRALV